VYCLNPKIQIPNYKWFDRPFDRLTVLSKVEGLTTLSPPVESLMVYDRIKRQGRTIDLNRKDRATHGASACAARAIPQIFILQSSIPACPVCFLLFDKKFDALT
jgi:hypothetical protein